MSWASKYSSSSIVHQNKISNVYRQSNFFVKRMFCKQSSIKANFFSIADQLSENRFKSRNGSRWRGRKTDGDRKTVSATTAGSLWLNTDWVYLPIITPASIIPNKRGSLARSAVFASSSARPVANRRLSSIITRR